MRFVAGKCFGIGELAIDDHIDFPGVLVEFCIPDDFQVIRIGNLLQPPQRSHDGLDHLRVFRTEKHDVPYQGMTSGLMDLREFAFAAAD